MTAKQTFSEGASQASADIASDIASAEVLATLPEGNFLENLAVGPDDAFYITSYVSREILRYHPNDGLSRFIELDCHPVGIVFDGDGTAYLCTHQTEIFSVKDTSKNNAIYRMDLEGNLDRWKIVEGAGFLNGMVCLAPGQLAIADSILGAIWQTDIVADTVELWIRDPRLEKTSLLSHAPAANGLKLFNGQLYISNFDRQIFLRVPIMESGAVGKIEIVHENLEIDDFTFSQNGTLYGATHRDQVLRIKPNGERHVIAGIEQGILGNTAVAFGQTALEQTKLYVISDGGLALGPELQMAKIVRLEVNERGYQG